MDFGTMRSPGIASMSRRCSGDQTTSGSSVQQSCGWIGHQSRCCERFLEDGRRSPRRFVLEEVLVARAAARRSSACFSGDANASGVQIRGAHAGHAQLADRRPQRDRHLRLVGERAEVSALLRQRRAAAA